MLANEQIKSIQNTFITRHTSQANLARVRRFPNYPPPPFHPVIHITLLYPKLSHVLSNTFSPCLLAPSSTSHTRNLQRLTCFHPVTIILHLHMTKPSISNSPY